MKHPKILPLPQAGPNRSILTILTTDGARPVRIVALDRPSQTAASRVKVIFAAVIDEETAASVAEFRLEMN